MSLRSSIVLLASLSVLAALAGCGGSGNSTGNGTITGTTSTNSELNGSYTFSTAGTDSGGNFFAIAGTFAANGSGGVTGGSLDYNDPVAGIVGPFAISGGSYAVGSDGRGTATLTASQLGKIGFDFVLSSTSHGLITRFDSGGSGSGTIDLQSSITQASLANNSYAFSLSGLDGNGAAVLAGAFTLDSSGNITAGVQDFNDGLNQSVAQPLTGTVSLTSAPPSATLNGPLGALTFDIYPVDQTHLKFIETDSIAAVTGDIFTQQNASIPSGAAVFTVGGLDISGPPFAAGGLLTFNSDMTISGGSEDINNDGTVLSQAFTGTYIAPSGGRSTISLSGFSPAIQFAAYPSSGGLLMVEMDTGGISAGTALAQSATSFSTSGGYGFNLSASNLSAGIEVDNIAAFTANSSITGTIDENDEGSTHAGEALTGTFTAPTGGRGTMTLQDSNSGTSNYNYYVASASSVLVIETDSGQVGVGSFLGQSGVGSSASLVHAAMARPKAGFHPALKKKLVGN